MCCHLDSISVVILIRTDTTLDLSQKAEKVCPEMDLRVLGVIMLLASLRLYIRARGPRADQKLREGH